MKQRGKCSLKLEEYTNKTFKYLLNTVEKTFDAWKEKHKRKLIHAVLQQQRQSPLFPCFFFLF